MLLPFFEHLEDEHQFNIAQTIHYATIVAYSPDVATRARMVQRLELANFIGISRLEREVRWASARLAAINAVRLATDRSYLSERLTVLVIRCLELDAQCEAIEVCLDNLAADDPRRDAASTAELLALQQGLARL